MSNQIMIQECVDTTSKTILKGFKKLKFCLKFPSFLLGRVVKELLTFALQFTFFSKSSNFNSFQIKKKNQNLNNKF